MPPDRRAPLPQPPSVAPSLTPAAPSALEHDATLAECELRDLALTDQRARGVTMQAVRLAGVELARSQLEHLRITDAAMARCNLANLEARGAHLTRVALSASRVTGVELSEGVLADVSFSDCRIDLASFSFSRLERVSFEDCLLAQSGFLDARLDGVRFEGCDMSECDFRGAKLSRCEIRRCELSGLQGIASLRGVAMEAQTIVALADVWAAALGIELLEAD